MVACKLVVRNMRRKTEKQVKEKENKKIAK